MCTRVNCRNCGKVTYSGCGEHLDQVFAGVPDDQRCNCDYAETSANNNPSIFGKIFGRK